MDLSKCFCGWWVWMDVSWPKGWTVDYNYWLLPSNYVSFPHLSSCMDYPLGSYTPMQPVDLVGCISCEPWMTWASQHILFLDYSYSFMGGNCVLRWSHQVNFRNLTWNDGTEALSTTDHEWGNMGSKLGWQPPITSGGADLRIRSITRMTDGEEEGLWAFHYMLDLVNQPPTWPASGLPLWASKPVY